MSTLQMLDVAIGIFFIFLLLSLICSAGNELIEAIIKKRASDLHRGIKELLDGSDDNNGIESDLLKKFYRHPLISGLFKGSYNSKSSRNLPSYIPAGNFALALLDIIMPATPEKLSGAAEPANAPVKEDVPAGAGNMARNTPAGSLSGIREAVTNMAESNARQALLTLIDAAGNDKRRVRENIELWYNSSMDRVSGWYKRRVQWILIVLGLLTAVAMNADTIAIFKSLMKDEPLRNSLVAATSEYAKAGTVRDSFQSPEDRVENNIRRLNDLRLPIGWDWRAHNFTQDSIQKNSGHFTNYVSNAELAIPPDRFWPWFFKILGWFLTALAVSQGAPFWFDLFNKFMVIRSTVKPHEKSPDEASEDRQKK